MMKKMILVLAVLFTMANGVGCTSYDTNATDDMDSGASESLTEGITYGKSVMDSENDLYVSNSEVYQLDELDQSGESYNEIIENSFITTEEEGTSTFSIDVDTASYANIRDILSYGELPDPDAVRIEEMINYFDYDYETPTDDAPLSIHTKVAACPWETEDYVTVIGIKGEEIDKEALPPSNIVLLIDVSGSMNDANKLPLLKDSFEKLIDNLTKKDRISLVVYAGAAGVVLEGAEGSDKDKILDALDDLYAGGSTAGGEGIELAYKIAKKYYIEEGNNRVVLATDGDFNVGLDSVSELEDFIEEKRDDGIFLSVIGFGRGNTRDDIMETLADKGNGNYAYIDSLSEANKVFTKEFTGTMFAIAKDVKIQIEFNKDFIESYRLVGYENRVLENEDFEDDTKDAGELGIGHEVTALYQLVLVEGVDLSEVTEDIYTVKLRYKEPDSETSQEITNTTVEFVKDIKEDYDFGFALAVAEFGLLLRDSEFKGDASTAFIKEIVRINIQNDWDEYKEELLNVISDYEDALVTREYSTSD
jgi:Ca-activated chloride channel family protein